VAGFTTDKNIIFRRDTWLYPHYTALRILHGVYRHRIAPRLMMVGSATTRSPGGGLRGLPGGGRRSSGISLPTRPPQLKFERSGCPFNLSKDIVASIDHANTNYRADFVFETLHVASNLSFSVTLLPTFTIIWRNFSEYSLTDPVCWSLLREFHARSFSYGST
jgi:hypothetical protein